MVVFSINRHKVSLSYMTNTEIDIDLAKLVDQMYIDKLVFQESEIKCLTLQLIKGVIFLILRWLMSMKNILFIAI